MFFLLSKVVKPFVLPTGLLFLALLAALWSLHRKRDRRAKILLAVAVAFFYLLSIEPTAAMLSATLERPFSTPQETHRGNVVVVLGGGASVTDGGVSSGELSGASWRRLWHGIELSLARDPQVPIFYTGGSGDPFRPVSHEATIARRIGIAVGIAPDRFFIESVSRDTYENGRAIKNFLHEQFGTEQPTIILVTSARHMRRSLGVLRHFGIDAVPSPADFGQELQQWTLLSFVPTHDYFSESTAVIHEWVGIVSYWLRGRLS